MEEVTNAHTNNHVVLTVDIVSAYISNNSVRAIDLAELIASVHQTLSSLGHPVAEAVEQPEKASPAQIRKSIAPDGLISFIDGKTYKTMKRHLTRHDLTPETYRARYGLPADYPMVAASYSAARSALARSIGLGQTNPKVEPKAAAAKGTTSEVPKPRGRPRKTNKEPQAIAAE